MDKDVILEECIFEMAMLARGESSGNDVGVVLEAVSALGFDKLGDDTKEELQKMAEHFGWPDCDIPHGLWCGKKIGATQ